MKYDNKSFQERYEAWKNGADYWKDIRGVNLGGDTQEEPSEEEQKKLDDQVAKVLAEYNRGKGSNGNDSINSFVGRIGPLVGRALNRYGYGESAYYNIMRQLAYESNYGTSNIARKQHNYGGVGFNGKTYTTYKSDEDFVNNYIDLMRNKYDSALKAKTTQDYARQLKQRGYYQDTLQNYTRNLMGMNTLAKAAFNHRKKNPDMYNYNVQYSDLLKDFDEVRNASPIIQSTPSIKQPQTINAAISRTLLGPTEDQNKQAAQNLINRKLYEEITTPTLPNILNLLPTNNFGKDAYGQKFWQRKNNNLHFDEGKDPYLYKPNDYDFVQARDLEYEAGPDGHWPSRNYKTGRYLKSPTHPTLYKGIISDNSLGYYPYYKDGAIYTNTWKGNEPYTQMLENYIQYRYGKSKKKNAKAK